MLKIFLVFLCLASGPAFAAGYSGLIAPEEEEDQQQAAPAPQQQPETAAQPAYSGSVLVPDPEAQPAPAAVAAKKAPEPKKPAVKTAAQKKAAPKKTPQKKAQVAATLKPLKVGKVSEDEYAVNRRIERAMRKIGDRTKPPAERAAWAKKSYASLARMAEGLKVQAAIPDSAYKKQGLSDAYIAEERRNNEAARARLNEALTKLYPYR